MDAIILYLAQEHNAKDELLQRTNDTVEDLLSELRRYDDEVNRLMDVNGQLHAEITQLAIRNRAYRDTARYHYRKYNDLRTRMRTMRPPLVIDLTSDSDSDNESDEI